MAVKPNLALIPSGVKASKVYSVLPSDGVGDFDFSRSGSATRINKDGLIETVASNVPRLNYPLIDGVVSGCPSLLLEPQSTNLIKYSEDFDNSYWIKNGSPVITSDYGLSPKGVKNSSRIVFSNSNEAVYTTLTHTGNNETFSIYVKGVSGETIKFGRGVNISIGNVFTLNGDWQRIDNLSTTGTALSISTFSGVTARDIEVWGAQSEEQSYPTSYIPTSGTTATRSAETCNNSGDANTFNDSEGVLMIEGRSLSELDVTARYIQMSDGTTTPNGIQLRYYTSTNSFQALYYTNSAYQAVLSYTLPNSSENNKIAFKYKENDFALWVNGIEVATDLNGLTGASLSKLKFDYNNFSDFYGSAKQIQYFDTALTDTDLEELTSWTSFNEMAESQLYSVY